LIREGAGEHVDMERPNKDTHRIRPKHRAAAEFEFLFLGAIKPLPLLSIHP
jgi:hypothetical protein